MKFIDVITASRRREQSQALRDRIAPYTAKGLTDAEVKERLFGRRAYWRTGKRA